MSDEVSNALYTLMKELQGRVDKLETDVDRVLFLMNQELSQRHGKTITIVSETV